MRIFCWYIFFLKFDYSSWLKRINACFQINLNKAKRDLLPESGMIKQFSKTPYIKPSNFILDRMTGKPNADYRRSPPPSKSTMLPDLSWMLVLLFDNYGRRVSLFWTCFALYVLRDFSDVYLHSIIVRIQTIFFLFLSFISLA